MDSFAAIVLNWNGATDTVECLRSLRASTLPLHLIVVDNGSTDDSVAVIEASQLADTLICTGSNLGYAGGNNVGLARALRDGFEIITILNNDTVAQPDLGEALVAALPRGTARAASPDIRYYDEPERSWFLGGAMDRGWGYQFPPAEQRAGSTQLLTGCCIAARRDVWERVGTFDEGFFLIFEDFDWSLRAASRGVELLTVPEAVLFHKTGRSFASSATAGLLAAFYFARNGMRLGWRWDRAHCVSFMVRGVLRPAAGDLVRRRLRQTLFSVSGVAAFVLGQKGAAPRALVRFAERTASPDARARQQADPSGRINS